MLNAWENYSYNFSTNEIAEDDTETQETLNKKIVSLIGNETEQSLFDFLTNGGVYIRPLDERYSFEYFTCRINENGEVCFSCDTLNLENRSEGELMEYAVALGFYDEAIEHGRNPVSWLIEEHGCNTVSWLIEQNPMSYFSNIPGHTNELIDKLHEHGLFTEEFYHQNVFIVASEESQDGYAFYLKERGTSPESEGVDYYYADDGGIVGADCALDLIDYCKSQGLSLIGQDKNTLINQTMMILGPELEEITLRFLMQISEMHSLSGSVHEAYSELIKDYHKAVHENRHIVEDGICSMWYYNPDYREAPEDYFEIMTNIGEQIIRDRFENKFARDIAHEYLDEYGKSQGKYYEITESFHQYDSGLMSVYLEIVVYDISPKEGAAKAKEEIGIDAPYTVFGIDVDDIRNGDIPESFFSKIYSVSEKSSKEKENTFIID